MLELFKNAGVVAWPLALCSILALAIILERLFTLYRLQAVEERALMVLQLALEKHDDAMLQDSAISAAPVTQIINSLLPMRGGSDDSIDAAAQISLGIQRLRIRRYLGTLATIGSTSPFIGLFGTVLGVMRAFEEMAHSQLTGERMAGGISEALSATALGLLVAIPSVMAYNYFTGRAQSILLHIHGHTSRLMPLLREQSEQRQEA